VPVEVAERATNALPPGSARTAWSLWAAAPPSGWPRRSPWSWASHRGRAHHLRRLRADHDLRPQPGRAQADRPGPSGPAQGRPLRPGADRAAPITAVTAATGMNALAHGVEAFYGPGANPVSDALAEAGIRALAGGLPLGGRAPRELERRTGRRCAAPGWPAPPWPSPGPGSTTSSATCWGCLRSRPRRHERCAPSPRRPVRHPGRAGGGGQGGGCARRRRRRRRLLRPRPAARRARSLADLGLARADLDRAAALCAARSTAGRRPQGWTELRALLGAAHAGRPPGEATPATCTIRGGPNKEVAVADQPVHPSLDDLLRAGRLDRRRFLRLTGATGGRRRRSRACSPPARRRGERRRYQWRRSPGTGHQARLRQPPDRSPGRLRRGRHLHPRRRPGRPQGRAADRRNRPRGRDPGQGQPVDPNRAATVAGDLITGVRGRPNPGHRHPGDHQPGGRPGSRPTACPPSPASLPGSRTSSAARATRRSPSSGPTTSSGGWRTSSRCSPTSGPRSRPTRWSGPLWPNDGDGNAWGDPKLGFPPALKKAGYTVVDPGRYQNQTDDFSSQISSSRRPRPRS
jgi:hypothetical protein